MPSPGKTNEARNAWQREHRKNNPEMYKAYKDQHYEKHKEEVLKRSKERAKSRRQKVLDHYGNKCACCGETKYEFLALDHINSDGNRQRKAQKGIRGPQFVSWILANNFPDTIQILCHNCNNAKGFYGYCPHHPDQKI